MNWGLRFVAFFATIVASSIFAGEPKVEQLLRGKRPTTPREANALKLALSQQQKKEQQLLQQQAWQWQASQQEALQQQVRQRQEFGQPSWQRQIGPQDQVFPQAIVPGSASLAFPRNGAYAYDGWGPTLGGALPLQGAYVYNRGVATSGSAIPGNASYVYQGYGGSFQGGGGSIPKNGAFCYQNGK